MNALKCREPLPAHLCKLAHKTGVVSKLHMADFLVDELVL